MTADKIEMLGILMSEVPLAPASLPRYAANLFAGLTEDEALGPPPPPSPSFNPWAAPPFFFLYSLCKLCCKIKKKNASCR
jgi:hypothetical protein